MSYVISTDGTTVEFESEYWVDGEPSGTITKELSLDDVKHILDEMLTVYNTATDTYTDRYTNVEYIGVENGRYSDACSKCAFDVGKPEARNCLDLTRPRCTSLNRGDEKTIYFIKKPK